MPEASQELRFTSDSIFSGQTGVIDKEGCVIHGVSVITGGIEADGHNLIVDETTLSQIQACAKERGKCPVALDHGSGVKDLNGYLTSFRMDGKQLRADWHLLKSHDETRKMLERAEVMPDCFGLSTAFKGPPKGVPIGNGKMGARCEKLLSVDAVLRPAANPGGLFSTPNVDTNKRGMAEDIKAANQEPTMADVLKAVTDLTGRLDKHDEIFSQLTSNENDDLPTLDQLDQMTDEQLSDLGISRGEVDTAIAEVLAAEGANEDPNAAGKGAADPNAAANADAAAGTVAGGGVDYSSPGTVGAALSALRKDVLELTRKQTSVELKAKKDAEDHEFAEIEGKVLKLAGQRDEAIKLAEKAIAENEALRLAVKTGTRPVKPGIDPGVRFFSANGDGELHAFQQRVKDLQADGKKTEAQAITFAQKENPALHADWLMSLKKSPVTVE